MAKLLYRLGLSTAKHSYRTIGIWILVVLAITTANHRFGGEPNNNFTLPGTDSQQARELLEKKFPQQTNVTGMLVFKAKSGGISDPAVTAQIRSTIKELTTIEHVVSVNDPTSGDKIAAISPTTAVAFGQFELDIEPGEVSSHLAQRLALVSDSHTTDLLQVELGGDALSAQEEPPASEIIGLSVAIVVLLIAFGSAFAAGTTLLVALLGIITGLSAVGLLAGIIDMDSAAPILATMLGLGVGIDYALFIVTRHRQFLREGKEPREAAALATATSGGAVVFAGGTVVIAIMGLVIPGIPMVTSMGFASALTVAVMVLISITLLPAILGALGHRIDKLKVPGVKLQAEDAHDAPAARWARRVSARPWLSAGLALALLLTLAIPVFSLRLGNPDDSTLPTSNTRKRAYELLAEGFGPGFNGPILIAVDESDSPGLSDRLLPKVVADPGVAFAINAAESQDKKVKIIQAFPVAPPQAAGTEALVHRLRTDVLAPEIKASGGEAHLTGRTAVFVDISDKIISSLPTFIGAVLVLSFLLLMIVFRSILVPLKAALLNLLAISASFGVIVAVFQWGWLKNLVGLDNPVPIISFLPMIMFAILFGLSMDYEVFILSRVREEYLRTNSSHESVVRGIAGTARVVTSAAIIMISVFGAFALGHNPVIKMFGIGLAVAVFLDATVVRMVLVPATMELLGDSNWWFPRWLAKVVPNVDIEGEHFDTSAGRDQDPVTVFDVDDNAGLRLGVDEPVDDAELV